MTDETILRGEFREIEPIIARALLLAEAKAFSTAADRLSRTHDTVPELLRILPRGRGAQDVGAGEGGQEVSRPTKEQVELWDAINEYAAACGGRPEGDPTERRMDAVARVSRAVEAAGLDWPAVADAAALRAALADLVCQVEDSGLHDPACIASPDEGDDDTDEGKGCDCRPALEPALKALAGAGGREMLRRYRQAVGFVSDWACSSMHTDAGPPWRARAKDILDHAEGVDR